MEESCYWVLSQDWSFCFLPPGGYSNVKIFGYAEFLASLAILAVIFTLVDIRYKFRVAVAPLPIMHTAFIVIAFVGFGTLISDIWVAEGWWVLKENPITQALWQGILGALFLLTFIAWIWYAFIFPPKFGRLNAQRYLKFVYRAILKGSPSELNVIADELSRSAKNIIENSYSISERGQLTSNKVNVRSVAYELLLLVADKKLCRSIVSSCSVTALSFLNEVKAQSKYDLPIGDFVVNLSTEALCDKDSLLYHESQGSYSGLVGYIKPLSYALYGSYDLLSSLGRRHRSPIDMDYRVFRDWDASNWRAYSKATIISLKSYLDATNGKVFSSEIYRAIENIKNSFSDFYKLDGLEEYYYSDQYQKFDIAIEFLEDLIKAVDEQSTLVHYNLKEIKGSRNQDVLDLAAKLMMNLIIAAIKVKGPQWTAWSIHYGSLWSKFFTLTEDSKARKVFRYKVRRLIYDEIKSISTSPNYLNVRILIYSLNVMGLKDKKSSLDKNHRALLLVILSWAPKNFRNLYIDYPDVVNSSMLGSISFDASTFQIIKAYRPGIGKSIPTIETLQV